MRNQILINVDSNNIVCSNFEKSNNKFLIKYYKRYELNNFEILNLNIFNCNLITNYIYEFLIENNLIRYPLCLSLNGVEIHEDIFKVYDDNDIKEKLSNFKSTIFQLIDISQNNEKTFYIAGIKNILLFQYKLILINSQIKISQIISENILLIKLLKLNNKLNDIKNLEMLKSFFLDYCNKFKISDFVDFTKIEIDIENEKKFLLKALIFYL